MWSMETEALEPLAGNGGLHPEVKSQSLKAEGKDAASLERSPNEPYGSSDP